MGGVNGGVGGVCGSSKGVGVVGGLWCPNIWGGVFVGAQGGGGCTRVIPDRGGVCWCCLGTRYIGDRVIVGGMMVIFILG